MSDKNIKLIRGQIRQIVQDLLPELLKTEMSKAISKDVSDLATKRLDALATAVADKMNEINERSKDVQAYLLRNTTPQAPKASEAPVEPPAI